MSDIAIRVKGLGKSYRLGKSAGGNAGYCTLRDEVMQIPARLRGALGLGRSPASEEFWALRDVSFEVKRGEVLGVIGRNGAGKSTLLKILSRIVEPTAGEVDIYGRVGSLLEVGTGFHPELTGRENIYLSGAILGMRRHEVRARLDEIVAFSDLEQFIDTPCKHYSSGMYARLGFAVAAHLDADILLVDEVLAVGDVEFQQRCLGKMGKVAESGRTVLFISHNMAAMGRLCTSALLLEGGRSVLRGGVGSCINGYMKSMRSLGDPLVSLERSGLRLDEFSTHGRDGNLQARFSTTECVVVMMSISMIQRLDRLRCGFELLKNETGEVIFLSFDDDREERPRDAGTYRLRAVIPPNLLKAGEYRLAFAAGIHNEYWISKEEVFRAFSVDNVDGVNSRRGDSRPGLIAPLIEWEVLK